METLGVLTPCPKPVVEPHTHECAQKRVEEKPAVWIGKEKCWSWSVDSGEEASTAITGGDRIQVIERNLPDVFFRGLGRVNWPRFRKPCGRPFKVPFMLGFRSALVCRTSTTTPSFLSRKLKVNSISLTSPSGGFRIEKSFTARVDFSITADRFRPSPPTWKRSGSLATISSPLMVFSPLFQRIRMDLVRRGILMPLY